MFKNNRFKKQRIALGCALSMAVLAPAANASTLIGAYLPADGWNPGEAINFNSLSDKPLGFQTVFTAFNHSWDHLYWQSTFINDTGSVPMVSWMPVDLSRPGDNLLPEITAGAWDWYIDNWAMGLKGWAESSNSSVTPMIYLRFAHEFNGSWYPYANSPNELIAAWQKIHDRFVELGADQYIEWVWNVNNVNVDNYNDITLYYPGDDYVDWTSIDGYNWGSNYTWTSWDDFSTVFADTYETLTTNYPNKPIMIAEFGSADPWDYPDPSKYQYGDNSDAVENKDVWMEESLNAIEDLYPSIMALGLFNIDKELSWSISNSWSTGLTGWNNGLQSAHFVSSLPPGTLANMANDDGQGASENYNDDGSGGFFSDGTDYMAIDGDTSTIAMDGSEVTTRGARGKAKGKKKKSRGMAGNPRTPTSHSTEFDVPAETILLSKKEERRLNKARKRQLAAVKSKTRKNRIRQNLKSMNAAQMAQFRASKMSVLNY